MDTKIFVVIGLGKFGFNLAKFLAQMDSDIEVIAIDKDQEKIDEIAPYVTKAYCLDVTDEEALSEIGIEDTEAIVIAFSTDIAANILCASILKDLGANNIIAKALDERHKKILKKLGISFVVEPEKDMALKLAEHLAKGDILNRILLEGDVGLFEVCVPKNFEGKTLQDLDLRKKYDINVVAIKRGDKVIVPPSPIDPLKEGDIFVIIAPSKQVQKFVKDMVSNFK